MESIAEEVNAVNKQENSQDTSNSPSEVKLRKRRYSTKSRHVSGFLRSVNVRGIKKFFSPSKDHHKHANSNMRSASLTTPRPKRSRNNSLSGNSTINRSLVKTVQRKLNWKDSSKGMQQGDLINCQIDECLNIKAKSPTCEIQNNYQEDREEVANALTQTHRAINPMDIDSYPSSINLSANMDKQSENSAIGSIPPPTTVTLEMVYTMFQRLENKVDSIEAAMVNQVIPPAKQEEIKDNLLHQVDFSFNPIKDQQQRYQHQNRVMSGVIDRFAMSLADVQGKIESLELNNSKKCATILNLGLKSTNKRDKLNELFEFLHTNTGVQVGLDDVYETGNSIPPTLNVVFQTIEDKRLLFENKKYLKNYQNDDGTKVYINDHLPLTIAEKKKRDREIVQYNKTLEKDSHLEIEHTKDGLKIQGELYRKKVQASTPNELIDISPERLTAIMAQKLQIGRELTCDGSKFQAFSAAVRSHKEIRDLYIKMKLCFPQARHVVCAYYLQDMDHQPHYDCDYWDDEEPGAGRLIANLLRVNKISHRVIFVIRYCGNVKLSSERFDMYREAAIDVVKTGSWNEVLKTTQRVKDDDDALLNPTKKSQPTQKPQRVRNEGHFRGRGRGPSTPQRNSQPNQQSKSKQREHLLDSSAKRGSSTPHTRRDAIHHPQYQGKTYAAITSEEMANSFMFAKPMSALTRVEDQDSLD